MNRDVPAAALLSLVLIAAAGARAAAPEPPRAVLIIDEADPSDGIPTTFSTTLRRKLIEAQPHVAVYAETLDFARFTEARQEAVLRSYLREKYRELRFAAIAAVGASALEIAMRARPDLWRGTPIVFGAIDELSLSQIELEPGVTGVAMQRTIRSMADAARVVVPGLKHVVILGGTLRRDAYRRQYLTELPLLAKEVAVTNLTGKPLNEQLKHVQHLPRDTAILYTSLFIDDAGTRYSGADALAEIARVASRPIIVDVASLVGAGAAGGFAIDNVPYGEQVAALVLRVVDGAEVAAIPVSTSEYTRPIFDHRQLERWRISEASLPSGSDVRFRAPTAWGQYRWQIVLIALALAAQTALIVGLLLQRRARVRAQIEVQSRRVELAHASRLAVVGELTASIAHEINQPLGAILSNADAAEMLLESGPARLAEVRQILEDIRKDDLRASEVVRRIRGLVQKHEPEIEPYDLNEVVDDCVRMVRGDAGRRGVAVETSLGELPILHGDRVQVQQVLLNLMLNGMDAMASTPESARLLSIHTARGLAGVADVAVTDAGPGIPAANLARVFDPFYTTKHGGMGLGLSIARSIVEAQGGRIWAENSKAGGATFRFELPLGRRKRGS